MAANVKNPLFWVPWAVGVVYGLFYLYVIGDFTLSAPPRWDFYGTALTWERVFSARSLFMFEAIAVLEAGYLVWLISPLNLLITVALSGLLGANIHGALYLRAHPQACRYSGRGGTWLSALPALMAGGACCAPSLILLLGVPSLGAFSAYFGWLLPLSFVALVGNRIWQRRRGAPPL